MSWVRELCTKTLGRFVIVLLATSLLVFQTANSRFRPFIVRSIDFEDLHHGKLLTKSVLATFWGMRSVTSCALACAVNPKCRSFNFCESLKCELNREDLFSGDFMDNWVDDRNCLYGGMLQESIPECYDGEDFKDIRDDLDPGKCEINQKRIDADMRALEDMPTIQEKTNVQYKLFQSKEGVQFYGHGGFAPANNTVLVKVLEFYKVGTLQISQNGWNDAQAFCEQEGGNLFYRLDGTREQLDFFYDTFGDDNFWVGVKAAGAVSDNTWINVKGEAVGADKLFWGNGLMLNHSDRAFVGLRYGAGGRAYLKNQDPRHTNGICDLLN